MKNDYLGGVLAFLGILILCLGLFISVVVITPRIDTHTQTQTVLVDDFKYHDGTLIYNNTEFHHISSMSATNRSNGTLALTYTESITVRDQSASQDVFGVMAVAAMSMVVTGVIVSNREEDE